MNGMTYLEMLCDHPYMVRQLDALFAMDGRECSRQQAIDARYCLDAVSVAPTGSDVADAYRDIVVPIRS